jgi:peptidoglycan/LPS O-acetylase OafA/YrhL
VARRYGFGAVFAVAGTAVAISYVAITALAHFFAFHFGNNTFLYYNILNQLPVFLLGIFAFLRYESTNEGRLAHPVLSWIGFVALTLTSLALFRADKPLNFIIIPTLAGLSFVLLLDIRRGSRRPLRPLARIGQLSYSLYVFHFFFAFYVARFIVKLIPFELPAPVILIGLYVGVVALTYLVALVAERIIERPGIELGRRLLRAFAPPAAAVQHSA